ncbi:MAG: hypothetical protein Kow0092_14800 [Deferrisomatales bacterium]
MKERLERFVRDLGVDDVGVASVSAYESPQSPPLPSIFPEVRSLVVLAYKELSTCESPSPQIAMAGRLDVMEFARSCNYKTARFLERETGGKAMTVPPSYPMEMTRRTKGAVADVSLRHAAVAAGLGVFGRHNLVIHPQLGTRVVFTAVMTDADLPADPPMQASLCTACNRCVENCPGGALDEEGRTHLMKCLKHSQPYGLAANIGFWSGFAEATPPERKEMLRADEYWRLYQSAFMGFQYFCFTCLKSCPVGQG